MGLSYFPSDNQFVNLFSLNAFNEPSLVQFIHRNLAYVIVFYYLFILYLAFKKRKTDYFKILTVIGLILFIQLFLGILTLLFGAHIILASLHQLGSIFLVSSTIYLLFYNKKIY